MKRIFSAILLFSFFLCGCSNTKTNASPESCFEDFLNNKMPAYREDGTEIWGKDIAFDENDWNCYKIGEQFDVDNDGENEQLIDGPKGGFFLDYRNNQLYVFPGVAEPVGDMTYRQIEGEYWIIYKDAVHSGREYYRMLQYKGSDKIEDIEIKRFEVSENEYEYYINSEQSTEKEFVDIKKKYIEE